MCPGSSSLQRPAAVKMGSKDAKSSPATRDTCWEGAAQLTLDSGSEEIGRLSGETFLEEGSGASLTIKKIPRGSEGGEMKGWCLSPQPSIRSGGDRHARKP